MVRLIDKIQEKINEKELVNTQKKKEYEKQCLEHWKKNKDDFFYFFVENLNKASIFISYRTLDCHPFSDIPLYFGESNRTSVYNSFGYYLEALNIKYSETKPNNGFLSEKDYEENGFYIDVNSELPGETKL